MFRKLILILPGLLVSSVALAISLPTVEKPATLVQETSYNAPIVDTINTFRDFYPSVVALEGHAPHGILKCMATVFKIVKIADGTRAAFLLTAGHCIQNVSRVDVHFYPLHGSTPITRNSSGHTPNSPILGDKVNLTDDNAHMDHDVGVLFVPGIPAHIRELPLSHEFNPMEVNAEYFSITRNHKDPKKLTQLHAVPLGSVDKYGRTRDLKVSSGRPEGVLSLQFHFSVIQPENGSRGICAGDSGSPVIALVSGQPVLMGPQGGSGHKFASELGHNTCGKSAYFYNASFNHTFVLAAMNAILRKRGYLKPNDPDYFDAL